MLLVLTVCAVPCSWIAAKIRHARREREAALAIEKLGCTARWVSKPWGPAWLRALLGDDVFGGVEVVGMRGTNADLARLEAFSRLKQLLLFGTGFTDDGLKHLQGMDQLQRLEFHHTKFTDAGLKHLRWLNRLESLSLDGNAVTDAGLEHIAGLGRLRKLSLCLTQVSDAGLEHLKGLANLKLLYLSGPRITEGGMDRLRRALPSCEISHAREASPDEFEVERGWRARKPYGIMRPPSGPPTKFNWSS